MVKSNAERARPDACVLIQIKTSTSTILSGALPFSAKCRFFCWRQNKINLTPLNFSLSLMFESSLACFGSDGYEWSYGAQQRDKEFAPTVYRLANYAFDRWHNCEYSRANKSCSCCRRPAVSLEMLMEKCFAEVYEMHAYDVDYMRFDA